MVKITYIWHDCFLVETDSANIVFDYWLDCDGEKRDVPGFLSGLDSAKPLYVLISHGHKDHYNTAVFSWFNKFSHVRYIVSHDVMKRMRHILSPTSVYSGPKVDPDSVTDLRPGGMFSEEGVNIAAFPSTDIGNSYVVEIDGRRFFHAGDLNAWIWKDESTDDEVRKAIGDYNACLRDIAVYLERSGSWVEDGDTDSRAIDYCFFPVDSRIGTDYFTGASIFVRKFDVHKFFPMHFALGSVGERDRYRKDALAFSRYCNAQRGEYIPLALSGSVYIDASVVSEG